MSVCELFEEDKEDTAIAYDGRGARLQSVSIWEKNKNLNIFWELC